MPVELLKAEEEWSLNLSGIVDIFDASALHQDALEVMSGPAGRVAVQMEQVESVDMSILQVLLALKRDLTAAGRTIRFEGVSAGLSNLCRLAGLQDELK